MNDAALIQITSPKKYNEGPGSIVEIKDWNLVPQNQNLHTGMGFLQN